ncbi:MAG: hypothetical protein ABJF10_09700 [Chthoniobacter sp.]|uniref:hypothetical protein n=1 Tax=Chthoniobacter sp. TaxID=2510640 RepID=UPI0032AA160C
MAKSDLVAIVVPYRTKITQDVFPGHTAEDSSELYDAFNTDLEILQVFKTDEPAKKDVTVLHFLYTLRPPKTPRRINNGCTFVKFLGEGAPKSFEAMVLNPIYGGQNTAWLAFLKRRPDGRYEAVTGDIDPSTSFRALKWETYDFSDPPATAEAVLPQPVKPASSTTGPVAFRKLAFYTFGILGGLLFVAAPWIVRGCAEPRWLRSALWLAGAATIVWSVLGLMLLFRVPVLTQQTSAVLQHAKLIVSGIAMGILVLMFASGEMFKARRDRKTNSGTTDYGAALRAHRVFRSRRITCSTSGQNPCFKKSRTLNPPPFSLLEAGIAHPPGEAGNLAFTGGIHVFFNFTGIEWDRWDYLCKAGGIGGGRRSESAREARRSGDGHSSRWLTSFASVADGIFAGRNAAAQTG